jgi:hypothetical protein
MEGTDSSRVEAEGRSVREGGRRYMEILGWYVHHRRVNCAAGNHTFSQFSLTAAV